MNPPAQIDQAAALALEREYGADACIQVAEDFNWQKHPNYYRPILEERRNGKATSHQRGNGRRPGSSDMDDPTGIAAWKLYQAGGN